MNKTYAASLSVGAGLADESGILPTILSQNPPLQPFFSCFCVSPSKVQMSEVKSKRHFPSAPLLLCSCALLLLLASGSALSTQHAACPADVETLTNRLLRDLPNYANRVTQQARRSSRTVDVYSYMLLAGRPEFAPLTLAPGERESAIPASISDQPQQVFITTLERNYTTGKAVELQQYHWIFLTQTVSGWRLAMMFSQTGLYPGGRPPTPPRDSSNGVVAQAIQMWLRDCQAGVIRDW